MSTATVKPMSDEDRMAELDRKSFRALKAAAQASHPKGAGGAAMCICGAGCGSSAACRALYILRDLVQVAEVPIEYRAWLEMAQFGLEAF